jgi:hypothetical protein
VELDRGDRPGQIAPSSRNDCGSYYCGLIAASAYIPLGLIIILSVRPRPERICH